jgi:hypothetical protein
LSCLCSSVPFLALLSLRRQSRTSGTWTLLARHVLLVYVSISLRSLSPRRFAISLVVLFCCYDSYRQRLLRRFSVQFAFLRRANAARRDICATRHLCATSSVFRYPCFHLTSYVLRSALLMFLLPLASSSPISVAQSCVSCCCAGGRYSPPFFTAFLSFCDQMQVIRCESQMPVSCGHAAVAISQSFLLLCTSIFWHRTLMQASLLVF